MKYTEQNAQTFNNWKQKYGLFWMEPIDHETFLKAVGGEWDITLTPVRKVPHAWLGDLTGKRVLGPPAARTARCWTFPTRSLTVSGPSPTGKDTRSRS